MLREREREWIAEATGAVPLSATPLAGGTHAETFLVLPQDLVLRRIPPEDGAAAREQRILSLLAEVAGPFPRLIAVYPDGDETGSPCVLVSRLPGKADALPNNPSLAARELASALARVHATDLPAESGLRDLTDRVRARRPEILPASSGGPVFSHGDFWSGNAL
ncbi:phosphotransferase [Streptomyces sp. SID5785]|uniref:phosphotransferase family protein n=1 Tax=Streptomyces sp. SID5785 TaxID=2690309 RepID=UPI0013619DAB|nr:phosphotransferase [Streptomyces sp. SID5785]MZD04089.1 phosphotransferase [Streptomyces sp. SID5785]